MIRVHGFSYDQRKDRDLGVSVSGEELVFHQHLPDKEHGGHRVRVSLSEAIRILGEGGRVVPAITGAAQLRFRDGNDPQEQNEILEGEVVVDGGKWWVCVQKQEPRTVLQRFGIEATW